MNWLVGAVIALAVLVAAMALAGSRLPVAHLAVSRARYEAEIDAVWSALEAEVAGQDMEVEIVERDAPHRLATRIPPGGSFGGTWAFDLASKKKGTSVTITERGEVYNVIFRFLSRFVFGHYAAQKQLLRAVGTRLHETTIPERLPAPA